MNILVLVAGTNEPSNSDTLAHAFIEGLKKQSAANVTKIRIRNLSIDHFRIEHYDQHFPHEPDFLKVKELLERADGFVIATPIWNFGVPAHLKNLIDRIGSFALDPETRSKGMLKGKPFFLIYTGGSPAPGWKVLMRRTTSFMPEGLRYFHTTYCGHYYEPKAMPGRGRFGLVVDKRPESLEEVRRKGFDFGKSVAEYVRTGKAPFYHRTRAKVMKWGENVLKKIS